MSSRKRITVKDWITSALAEQVDGRPCSAITLLHMKGLGGQSEEVKSRPIVSPVNIDELASFFVGRATGFSQDLPGLQDFKLLAFYGQNEPRDSFIFTCSDGQQVARTDATHAHHEPTSAGAMQQAMKHTEAVIALLLQSVNQNQQLVNGLAGMFVKERQETRQTEMEAIGIVRHATLSMLKERQEVRAQELEAMQGLQTRKMIADAIPHLVNRFTGREIFSEVANKAKIFDKLALSVTPQDLEILVQMGRISKEDALLLSAQFAAVVEEKKRELEALAKAPPEEAMEILPREHAANGTSKAESSS